MNETVIEKINKKALKEGMSYGCFVAKAYKKYNLNVSLTIYRDFIENYLKEKGRIKAPAIRQKLEHIYHCAELAKQIYNDELLEIAMLYHDIGRFTQYEKYGTFDDIREDHCVLGKKIFDKLIDTGKLPKSTISDIISNVIRYHGTTDLFELGDSANFVVKAQNIDRLENGCFGRYLEREVRNDEKHFSHYYECKSQKRPQKCIYNAFLRGEKIDKTDVGNYADYILFAASLCCEGARNFRDKLTKEQLDDCFEYYSYIFKEFLIDKIYKDLEDALYVGIYCRDKIW